MRLSGRDFSTRQLSEGKQYLAQQWVDQAQALNDLDVRFKVPPATKTASGKASVQLTTSFWTDWNREAARAFRPVSTALRSLEIIPRDLREKLVTRPLDALLDVFDPLFDRVAAPCRRTMNKYLRGGRRVEWFGKYIDIRISQPRIDDKCDVSTKNLLKKLRTIQAFIVCFLKKPLEFAGECIKEGIDIVGDVAGQVGAAVGEAVENIGKAAQAAGKAVGDVVDKAVKEAEKAAAGVASFFGGLVGLSGYSDGGLGEPFTIIAGAVAGAITTIAGVITEAVILAVIAGIVTIVTALIVVGIQTGAQERMIKDAVAAGGSAEALIQLPDGTVTKISANAAPVIVPSSAQPPEALADDEIGPAGAPPPPDKETLREEGKSEGAEEFPLIPVALAAGVALLLLSRR